MSAANGSTPSKASAEPQPLSSTKRKRSESETPIEDARSNQKAQPDTSIRSAVSTAGLRDICQVLQRCASAMSE